MPQYLKNCAAVFLMLFIASACSTQQVVKENATRASVAEQEVPENQLLDVAVQVMDPGLPATDKEIEEAGLYPEVRRSEARYIPYQLKETLQTTGYWGAVRVVPDARSVSDLQITGRIVESNGETLTLEVKAIDATGRVWLDKEYTDTASKFAYKGNVAGNVDPFQDIYNKISNDLVAARRGLSGNEIERIREVAKLRFATELSPYAYGDYLEQDKKGRYRAIKLPAQDDPMMARLAKVQEREYMLVDTLDEYYARFHADMKLPYDNWRQYNYTEVIALRELQASARTRYLAGAAMVLGGILIDKNSSTRAQSTVGVGAAIAGLYAIKSGWDKSKETKLHKDALEELDSSLSAEISPLVIDVDGRVVELTGSVEEQYQEWRRILRDIYAAETGLLQESEASPVSDGNKN
ncbi:MAG: hypothetical protein HKN59_02820 [Gammaproteobacteria bacterium]|nr:hypothetical protein [Gammaproteobacteria bacterium]